MKLFTDEKKVDIIQVKVLVATNLKKSHLKNLFLACQAIVITRLSSLWSSFKNFSVAHYSKSIKGINTKFRILTHHDKMQLQDQGLTLTGIVLELSPLLT